MSEVAIVAAITGASSVLTSGITALVTWRVSQNSSSVDLAKVNAELEQLQRGNREEERRNRQSTYHRFLDILIIVFQLLGKEIDHKEHGEAFDEYNHLLSGVLLFGPPSVGEGAHAVNKVYVKVWAALESEESENPAKSPAEHWQNASATFAGDFASATRELVSLMHSDVTRGIAEDPLQ
jgi:hypothetical protein